MKPKPYFSLILIEERGGRHVHARERTIVGVQESLDQFGKDGSYSTVVVIGPTFSGTGVAVAVASMVTHGMDGFNPRFEFLQPQDRKQFQLWLMDAEKARPAGTPRDIPPAGVRRKTSLSATEKARLKGGGKPTICGRHTGRGLSCTLPVDHDGACRGSPS